MVRTLRQKHLETSRASYAVEKNVPIPGCEDPERRKRLERDDLKWLAYYFSEDCGLPREATYWYPFVQQQREMILAIGNAIRFGGDQGIFGSRGEGKSTNATRTLLKYELTGEIDFALLLSATKGGAERALKEISGILVSNLKLRADYPEVCYPVIALQGVSQRAGAMTASGRYHNDRRKKFDRAPIGFSWSGEQLVFPKVPGSPSAGAVFATRGLDSEIRGLKELGIRPKVVVIDDPDTLDTTNNPNNARKVEDNIDMAVAGLGGQQRQISRVMLCTLPHTGIGVAHTYADRKKKPSFVSKRFSFLIHRPDRWDLWMEYVDIHRRCQHDGDRYAVGATVFYLDRREIMDAGAVVSNPHRVDETLTPNGDHKELTALQHYFNHWADKGRNGERYCRAELDNEILKEESRLEVRISSHRLTEVVGDMERKVVDSTTTKIVRGIDVRKIEVHHVTLASEISCNHQIVDYDLRAHGSSETTVEQAESMILANLRTLQREWLDSPHVDENGMRHTADLSLIDKGWVGTWNNEEGELKSWATQPVETFCMAAGLRHWLPAKGLSPYRSPAPSKDCMAGDHWHLNGGEGKERRCTEVIWDADHWHLLVEELFMLPDDHKDRFTLFIPRDGIHTNHKAFGEHITVGAEQYKEQKNAGQRSRKPRFIRDHWWDAVAMALVAQSVEEWMRANVQKPAEPRQPNANEEGSTARRRMNFRRRS